MKRKATFLSVFLFILAAGIIRADSDPRPYLHFCGANGTIFGSTTVLHTGETNILLDCGLFQEEGLLPEREIDRRNHFLPFPARQIDAVLISHAHSDHIGRLPLLFRQGFSGRIYCTRASAELIGIMLRLLQRIMEEEDVSLFPPDQVDRAIRSITPCDYYRTYTLRGGIRFQFLEAGHILGSAMIRLEFASGGREYSLLYTGDIGNPANPLLRRQDTIDEVDFLICESTYGNRLHNDPAADRKAFGEIINESVARGGKVIIPSYVLDRTQNVLYAINSLIRENAFDSRFNVYVDSPYANRLTDVYQKYPQLFSEEVQAENRSGKRPLSFPALKGRPPRGKITGPAVILAPGGMADKGAVRTHLADHLSDPNSAVIFVGFQADGSLGREILDRPKEVRIDGKTVPVRARTAYLSSFSGHADYRQICEWLNKARRVGRIFIIHGQPDSSRGLAGYIRDLTPFEATVPAFLEKIYLDTALPGEKETETPQEIMEEAAEAKPVR